MGEGTPEPPAGGERDSALELDGAPYGEPRGEAGEGDGGGIWDKAGGRAAAAGRGEVKLGAQDQNGAAGRKVEEEVPLATESQRGRTRMQSVLQAVALMALVLSLTVCIILSVVTRDVVPPADQLDVDNIVPVFADTHNLTEQMKRGDSLATAICYLKGIGGLEKDFKMAVKFLYEALDEGQKQALKYLGDAYKNGWGVEKHERRAKQFYKQASAKNGKRENIEL